MKIKEGMVVYLKSGSPSMTVKNVSEYGVCVCQWFDGITLHEGKFSDEALVTENPVLEPGILPISGGN
jgi:uncharacterized protein YodC (DUF2158 family)